MWRVGVDVGGTFTDLFGWNEESGERATAKVLTTQWDRSEGVIDAIRRAAQDPIEAIESSGLPFDEISTLVHGTTTATNALIERSYPDPALVTTDGFRDTIEIGRQHREELYDPYQVKPKPIVKRRYRYTVPERTDVNGNEERPLDLDAAREVAKAIQAEGIKSIAVCFINSYVNVAHERQMRDIILEHIPDAFVMLSGEVKPLFREHGRFVTTAISAALKPVMVEYFDHLVERLQEHGFKGSVLILKSSGGVMGIDLAKDHPEDLLESGPAGGVAYTRYLAEITKTPSIICTDMGGTSFDASIVEDGKGLITRSYELEFEVPVIVPMLDIHSVGAGGGSVGWVDTGGSLRVGPRSAGSYPGPACYGNGGTEPTVTDANFLLGRLEPTLGDKINLDREAAEKAVAGIAEQVGMETIEAAEAMVKISCEIMAQAVKKVVIDRGRDPRDFMLVSFGGAGPMHACMVANAMNIPRVVVPAAAGVGSAFGATVMDLRQDVEASMYAPTRSVDLDQLNALYADLEANARELMARDGVRGERVEIQRSAQMRYVGQTFEVETPIPDGVLDAAAVAAITDEFHKMHKREYGVSSDDFEPAFVSLSVAATAHMAEPPEFKRLSGEKMASLKNKRNVFFDGVWLECPVLNGQMLQPGDECTGPTVIEYSDSVCVLPPGVKAQVDEHGNLVIDIVLQQQAA
ncbi:MAG: hydantoinase/oxoprolinase family protein [Gammaproteobacteria bacterium]|nr:hydantoinase/oxoprolinase family protein [Gammaproteobacteria bacterium]